MGFGRSIGLRLIIDERLIGRLQVSQLHLGAAFFNARLVIDSDHFLADLALWRQIVNQPCRRRGVEKGAK